MKDYNSIMFRNGAIDRLKDRFGKKETIDVSYEIDGKEVPFSGTIREGKKRTVLNVSNPEYGTIKTKTIKKFKKPKK